jgi:cyclic pyranopterin phosphate synthase
MFTRTNMRNHKPLIDSFGRVHTSLPRLIKMLSAVPGIRDIALTTNGILLNEHGMEMRFIEFMPLDAEGNWQTEKVLSGKEIRGTLEAEFGALIPIQRHDPSQTAVDYEFADGPGRIGFINPVSQPFCHNCNRLRITAEGKIRNCLFSTHEWDARDFLRDGASDEEIANVVRAAVHAKKAGHGIDSDQFVKPERAMYQIGG